MLLRGMSIPDRNYARRLVERTGYYRLSAFYYPFRRFCEVPGEQDKVRCDRFREGTTFDDVAAFYLWDKQMRLEISDAIERIEVAIRASIIEVLGSLNPHGHRDPRSYKTSFSTAGEDGATPIDKFTTKLEEAFRFSKEEYAKHFKRRYAGPPPIWIEAGTWDWGNMTHILQYLDEKHKNAIAARINPSLPRKNMEAWVGALNSVRNDCAHHSRVWNKNLVNSPSFPKTSDFPEFEHLRGKHEKGATPSQKLYGALVVIAYLLKQFHPQTKWHIRMRDMVLGAKLPPEVGLPTAGFPEGWEDEQIWK
ncbi:Abi family protein [Phaeobacter italicus]|uniref:Abi family protein n=1 Tax=Phaeobacter italicus TaxID=481446 RepID=UPI003515CCEB